MTKESGYENTARPHILFWYRDSSDLITADVLYGVHESLAIPPAIPKCSRIHERDCVRLQAL